MQVWSGRRTLEVSLRANRCRRDFSRRAGLCLSGVGNLQLGKTTRVTSLDYVPQFFRHVSTVSQRGLFCTARVRFAPFSAHRFHSLAFAHLHASLAQFLPNLLVLASSSQLGFLSQLFRPESHEVPVPRLLRLEFGKTELFPNFPRTDHIFFFRQRQGREVGFTRGIDQER